ncbi:OLC1v1023303C1 [Oldenlandia corymbosa var. corymbosa]|uniref:non-specific serine/threonine protein kinase n=1 Tax=Oldenlandia corymbosa var. corymbosa TaxID=529605 RepID=A0AAV1BZQ3_OLDCO|nr:OLC1v1023303C1 [Oldenlandia corymbosa var. corymbosa]
MVFGNAECSNFRALPDHCLLNWSNSLNSKSCNDLTRTYLNGTIPREWGSMQLTTISLMGNRISGPIPAELGNISTLIELVLDQNQLNGTIPPDLGNLSNIQKLLILTQMTGELPPQLAKLTNLKDFLQFDHFAGTIPNFIENWTQLNRLNILGTSLNGPIPSGIASLSNLTDLRIGDLKGNGSSFPPLSGAKILRTFILRNCNISGPLPDYLGTLPTLKLLDLSFNNLTGPIPESFKSLSGTDIFLTRKEYLTFEWPFLRHAFTIIDLSYNNFTGDAVNSNCEPRQTNLFASSSRGNTSGIVSCLRDTIRCPKNTMPGDSSKFFPSASSWAFSSTGNFLDNNLPIDTYIGNTSGITGNNPELYLDARLSPLSLTYYGFCLGNGNYTVNLHFAEIKFTDDRTYASLGRRFFDIYIQGKLVKKDFNIEDEAGEFFWAGKGTTSIPVKGVYGPLISAISVESDFSPPTEHRNKLSAGSVVGIVIAVLFIISMVLVVLRWKGCWQNKYSLENGHNLSAQYPFCGKEDQKKKNIVKFANLLKHKGNLMELIDPRLGTDYDEEEIMLTLHIALCTNVTASDRPSMSSVVSMLEGRGIGKRSALELGCGIGKRSTSELSMSSKYNEFKALEFSNEPQSANSNESQIQEASPHLPFTASTSAKDLYPIILDSDYLLTRS